MTIIISELNLEKGLAKAGKSRYTDESGRGMQKDVLIHRDHVYVMNS